MARDIIITPKNAEPQIQFTGSGDVSSITLSVGSGVSPVSGIREAGSGISTLSFEGTQGQLFSITDNLSSGTIFSVADISGLPLLEVDASGAVKIAEFGTSTTVGLTDPKYNFDVFGTGGFQSVVSDKFELYASGDALSDGQEKLVIYDNNGTFEIRASGQGGGSINDFKIVSNTASISSSNNGLVAAAQGVGNNSILLLKLNNSNRYHFYNEAFTPSVGGKQLGGSSSSARWRGVWGQHLDVNGYNSTTTTLSVGSSAAQSANVAEFKASDDVVIAKVGPDGSIASSGDISASGTISAVDGDFSGTISVGDGDTNTATPSVGFINSPNMGFLRASINQMNWVVDANRKGINFARDNIGLTSNYAFGWRSAASLSSGTHDLTLRRDAAHTLAQRFGTNPQAFRVYGSGDSSNGEWVQVDHGATTANIATILSKSAGDGTTRRIDIGGFDGAAYRGLRLDTANGILDWQYNNATKFRVDANTCAISSTTTVTNDIRSDNIRPNTDSTYDNGLSTHRWANFYAVDGDFSGSVSGARGFFESATTTDSALTVVSAASQTANLQEWRASDDVVVAQVAPDGSIATSGDVKVSGDILFQDGSYLTTTSASTANELRYYGNYFWIRGGSHGISLNVANSAQGGANISQGHSFSWNSSAITSPTTSADTHLIRVDANKVGIKSTFKNSAGDYGELIASGVSLSGAYLANHVPQDTTNMLYNNAGTLTFNGSAVGGGGSVTGTPSGVAFFGGDGSLSDSSQIFYNSGTNVLTLKSDAPLIQFRGVDDNLALSIGDSQSNANEGGIVNFYWQGTSNSYFDTTSGKTRFRISNGDFWFRNNSNADIAKMEGATTDPLWSLYPQGTAQVGQVIKGQSAHSANLSEWHASDGVVVAKVEPDGSIASSGDISSSGNIISLGKIGINTDSPNDLLEIYNGNMRMRSNYSIKWQGDNNRIRGTSGGSGAGNVSIFAGGNLVGYFGGASAGGTGGLKIGGAAYSETDYKFEVLGSGAAHNLLASGSVVTSKLDSPDANFEQHVQGARLWWLTYTEAQFQRTRIRPGIDGGSDLGSDSYRWGLIAGKTGSFKTSATTDPTLTVTSAASQTANLQEWRASNDTVVASVAPDGSISSSGDIGASGSLTVSGGDVIFTGNHRKFSGSNTYTFFGGVNSFLLANTMFAPVNSQTVDKHLGYSTTGRRWTKIWGEQGDFSGNIAVSGSITCSTNATIDGTSTVGLFKLYGLGDASATDSEFLQVAHVANSYYISTKKTGSATGRDLIFQRDSQNALKLASSEITSYKSVIPSTDGTLNLGSSSYNWGDIHCGGELKTANIGYTDGDNAMTIADGGKVTFAAGFAVGSDAEGDILYHDGTSYVRLAKGTNDYILKMNGNVPNWEAESGGGGSSTLASLTDTNISSPANGHILIYDNATSKWDNALMTSTGGTISFTFGAGTINLESGLPPDNSIDSQHYVDGSIDHVHLAADCVDGDNIADNSINSEHYVDGSIDTAHIGDNQVTADKLAHTSVTAGSYINSSITVDAQGRITAASSGSGGGGGISDERLKGKVKIIEGSLDKILAMNPVEFEWHEGFEEIHNNSGKDIGFIAQDIEKIQPELVGEHKDFKTLEYSKFAPLIVGAIQELSDQIQEIKKHLNM